MTNSERTEAVRLMGALTLAINGKLSGKNLAEIVLNYKPITNVIETLVGAGAK